MLKTYVNIRAPWSIVNVVVIVVSVVVVTIVDAVVVFIFVVAGFFFLLLSKAPAFSLLIMHYIYTCI